MHATDVLRYGHLTLTGTLERVPEGRWELAGACGVWSVKDIVAHLASYELVLVSLLEHLIEGRPGAFASPFDADFNDGQVAQRRGLSSREALAEYQGAHARAIAFAGQLRPEAFRQAGLLPWYGAAYDLEDFLVYTYYGHKREHSAQIARVADG